MLQAQTETPAQRVQDMVRLGRTMLAECFEALHSTVKSDHAVMSRMTSGWPQMFLDADEIAGQEPAAHRRRFSPSEIKRAEELCTIYSRMKRFSDQEKKMALHHATHEAATWKSTGLRFGKPWAEVRSTHDAVLAAFAYHAAEYHRVDVKPPRETRLD